MTINVTKERLEQIVHAAGLETCDYEEVFDGITTGEIVKMARMLLAGMEQEPVAWRYRYVHTVKSIEHGTPFSTDWKYADDFSECNPSECFERQALYAAPQLSGNSEQVGWIKDEK